MGKSKDPDLYLSDKTGALLMLNKAERVLIKELLFMGLNSQSAKEYITKRLGKEYLEVGAKLYKTLGGK